MYSIKQILSNRWAVLFIALIGAIIAPVASLFLARPVYISSTEVYLSCNDSSAYSLCREFGHLLKSEEVANNVILSENLELSADEMTGRISWQAYKDTRFVTISVKGSSAAQARQLCSAVCSAASAKAEAVMPGLDVTVSAESTMPQSASEPNLVRYGLYGFGGGLLLGIILVIIFGSGDRPLSDKDRKNKEKASRKRTEVRSGFVGNPYTGEEYPAAANKDKTDKVSARPFTFTKAQPLKEEEDEAEEDDVKVYNVARARNRSAKAQRNPGQAAYGDAAGSASARTMPPRTSSPSVAGKKSARPTAMPRK